MDKFRTKLEELLKAVKASKKKLPAVPETHIEPTEHPTNIPKRDLPKILKDESTTAGIWPTPSGGVQEHPKLPRLSMDDGKEAINTTGGRGTSSDKPSMSSGQPRVHHVKIKKADDMQSKVKDAIIGAESKEGSIPSHQYNDPQYMKQRQKDIKGAAVKEHVKGNLSPKMKKGESCHIMKNGQWSMDKTPKK